MSTEDRRDYAKSVSLEHHTEEEEIPEWAKKFNALHQLFIEEYDGHAAIKNGHSCYLCNEVTYFSGLAWTYCKAGPPVPGANRAKYELKTVMPKNTDVTKVLELQRVQDRAIRKRMEMNYLNCPRGVNAGG
eukprot:5931684-Amphidinium_carterae.3